MHSQLPAPCWEGGFCIISWFSSKVNIPNEGQDCRKLEESLQQWVCWPERNCKDIWPFLCRCSKMCLDLSWAQWQRMPLSVFLPREIEWLPWRKDTRQIANIFIKIRGPYGIIKRCFQMFRQGTCSRSCAIMVQFHTEKQERKMSSLELCSKWVLDC